MKLSHALFPLIALGSSWAYAAEIGAPAPDCPLPTFAGDGQVDPAALSGKVVYLDFWASWCRPCAKAFPFLEQMHHDLAGQGLEIVAVNLDEYHDEAEGFLEKYPASFTIGSDPKGNCSRRYAIKGMPTSYLIDRQGRIREIHEGFKSSDADALRTAVERLLAQP